MSKTSKTVAILFCAGIVMGCGMRAAEWVIPAPERKLEMHHTIDSDAACVRIKEST